jgi:hypothetical protein
MAFSKLINWLARRGSSNAIGSPSPDMKLTPPPVQPSIAAKPSVIDLYLKTAPSPQGTLDIFQGEWSSLLPSPWQDLKAGTVQLFNDDRISWLADQIGGFTHKSVLELGPLEAGHTYMVEKLGATQIIAVESNTHAFLKCLIIKELLQLQQARFLYGDFIEFLRQQDESIQFQICMASGVLYHMKNPVELIGLLAKHCSEYLFLWTHYYDADIIANNPALTPKFPTSSQSQYGGFQHTLYRYEYQAALNWSGFCGGSAPISAWMSRNDIMECLHYFGFEIQAINFDQTDHPNGPALALVAKRR